MVPSFFIHCIVLVCSSALLLFHDGCFSFGFPLSARTLCRVVYFLHFYRVVF